MLTLGQVTQVTSESGSSKDAPMCRKVLHRLLIIEPARFGTDAERVRITAAVVLPAANEPEVFTTIAAPQTGIDGV
jgi:hypothetical protein